MPSRLFYINKSPGRVNQTIELKQNGRCRCCGKNFTSDEQIVSNGKRKKYYHRECAQKLNIFISLPKGLADKKLNPLNQHGPDSISLDLTLEKINGFKFNP